MKTHVQVSFLRYAVLQIKPHPFTNLIPHHNMMTPIFFKPIHQKKKLFIFGPLPCKIEASLQNNLPSQSKHVDKSYTTSYIYYILDLQFILKPFKEQVFLPLDSRVGSHKFNEHIKTPGSRQIDNQTPPTAASPQSQTSLRLF